jgi:hypothetical protein
MKTLYIVPRMYTHEEIQFIISATPSDYKDKSQEFWNYIESKLIPFQKKIKHIYRDILSKNGREALEYLQVIDAKGYTIIEKLVNAGAILEKTEDQTLLSEAESWLNLMRRGRLSGSIMELFQSNLSERNKFIAKVINDTLESGESGVLFIEATRRIQDLLSSDFKVIKVCPFEPIDYVNSYLKKKEIGKEDKS